MRKDVFTEIISEPRSGMFMILMDSPGRPTSDRSEGIHWLPVGFEQTKLLPILSSMKRDEKGWRLDD